MTFLWDEILRYHSPPHTPSLTRSSTESSICGTGSSALLTLGRRAVFLDTVDTVRRSLYKLYDVTSDGGVYWDTQGSLTPIDVYDSFSGSLNWINYQGHWGNKGFNNCWKEGTANICDIEDSPNGRMQSSMMGRPWGKRDVPSQVL
jgi:hypothetical protein